MTDTTAETSPSSEAPAESDVVSTPAEATTDASAASSPAADAKEAPANLLDVVKAVVEPKTQEPEAPSAAAADKPAEGDAQQAPKELTDAEIAELPFHNHPRFKEVLGQKNAFKAELAETTAKLSELAPHAEQWGNVRSFMEHNGLSDDDMLDGFRMMALLRTDPLAGRKAMADYLTSVDEALGLRLPADLREEVEGGYISEERALELSRARAATASASAYADQQRQEQERSQATRQTQEVAQRLTSTAESWETARRSRDPDFDAKADLIADRMRAISMAERIQPRTPDELTALLDRAHTDVTAYLKRIMPAPKSVARPTSASPATVAAPEPKNLHEAIALAAARGR